jgi:DNA (cytosine-5)-methyltransferase 1
MKGELTHGSLFSGIGGFDLGFERAGIRTVWQVEIDPYCRRVLELHFPDARRYHNIKRLKRIAIVDIISGGFPCQDISQAGRRRGIDGKRSGLWSEMWRIIRIVRPRFVVVENVAALLHRGIERVVGDLAAIGYDAEWDCIPACAVGAPHIRDRVWVIAYPSCDLRRASRDDRPEPSYGSNSFLADPANDGIGRREQFAEGSESAGHVAHAVGTGQQIIQGSPALAECNGVRSLSGSGWWRTEPDVGRVADGIPARVDRLRGLGNAIIPQIAEWIGKRIIEVNTTILSEVSGEGERPE